DWVFDLPTQMGPPSREETDSGTSVPALTIVWHPCAHRAGERLLLTAVAAGETVHLSRRAPDFLKPGSARGEPLADPRVSRTPIRLSGTAAGGVAITAPAGGTRVAS